MTEDIAATGVTVVELGLGLLGIAAGLYDGRPAVLIEPTDEKHEIGEEYLSDGDKIVEPSVVLIINDPRAAAVLIEALAQTIICGKENNG